MCGLDEIELARHVRFEVVGVGKDLRKNLWGDQRRSRKSIQTSGYVHKLCLEAIVPFLQFQSFLCQSLTAIDEPLSSILDSGVDLPIEY